jgi:hypothetical protein
LLIKVGVYDSIIVHMKLKVLGRRIWRKLTSWYARLRIKSTRVSQEPTKDGGLILSVPVLEVMVPPLVNNDWNQVYLSSDMLNELKYWIDELKVVHEITDLQFRVLDKYSQIGWDSVTGMMGRVVAVGVYGTKVTRKDLLDQISTATVELHEAVISEESQETELRKLRAINKVRELLREKNNRFGNVRNDVQIKL